ncbi:MAG: EamA family transporter [bacterium]
MLSVRVKKIILLNMVIVLYPVIAILAKMASMHPFMSKSFMLYLFFEIIFMGLYAVFWRYILKYLDVSMVYANRALVIIYNMLVGAFLFDESISLWNILGGLIIICGIGVVFSNADC